ncbi:MAG: MFS transporter [Gordonia sp. (in: high G+C Gram-positive bacteria)]|uniref:MFS transporter n=1 Tax=Gordonia sp. (in: high G+C Gram-positive bacteria) TaxID=84139 RepID=UPI0039E5F161
MNTTDSAPDRVRGTRNPVIIIVALGLSSLFVALMQSLVIPIQLELPELLGTTRSNASWVVTATLLGAAVAMPVSGRLADLLGKKPILVASALILLAGSLICALSDTLTPMLVGRVLQGLAMGYIPVAISFVREVAPVNMVNTAVASISAMLGVGGALGLPLAAWIAESLDWHALFWVSLGLAAAMTLMSLLVLPHVHDAHDGRLDVVGALGLTVGLVSFLVGVTKGNDWGWTDGVTLGLIVGGLVFLVLWGLFELRHDDPLVDLRTMARRPVLMTNLAAVLIGFGMMAQAIVIPQLLETPEITGYGLGQSILQAGLWMAPGGLMMLVFAPVSSKMLTTIGGRRTLALGAAVLSVGYVLAIFLTGAPWQLLIATCIGSAGVGIGYAAMPTLILENVPAEESGAGVGLNGLMRSVGTTVAGAVMAVVLTSKTMEIGPKATEIPTLGAYQLCFVIGAVAAAIGAALALLVYPLGTKKMTPAELQEKVTAEA